MVSFKNCKYQWQLQVTLKEHFDSLSLKTPEDFDKVADTILAGCEDYQSSQKVKRTVHLDTLSDSLKSDVQNILNYLDAPEENISSHFVNQNLTLFGLTVPISQEDTFAAYQELSKNILKEIAVEFKMKSHEARHNIIKKKEEALQEKQEEQLKLKTKKAPAPGSESSTYQIFLTNIIGGSEKLEEVLTKLKAEPSLSECRLSSGNLEGLFTDEDGLRWGFECKANNDEGFIIVIRNYDVLKLSITEPNKSISANEICMMIALPAKVFPNGHFQLQSTTIKDMLLVRVQEIAYMSFCEAFGKMNKINHLRLSRKIEELAQTRKYPPRPQIKEEILGLGQESFEMELISSFLTEVLQVLHQNSIHDESGDNLDNLDLTGLPQAILPGLRAFISRNPASEEQIEVDQPELQNSQEIIQQDVQVDVVPVPETVVQRRNPPRSARFNGENKRRRY